MDFHADIFPDVFAPWDGLDYKWLSGSDKIRDKVSLDPSKQEWRQKLEKNDVGKVATSNESEETKEEKPATEETTPLIPLPANTSPAIPPPSDPSSSTAYQPSEAEAPPSLPSSLSTITSATPINTTAPTKTLPSTYTRKFLIGRLHHPSKHYTSLPPTPTTSLRRTLSATSTHLAFPLSGPGGRIAILPLSNSGRNENPPTFSNGSALVDFSICPHRQKGDSDLPMRIFCAGEDGRVTVVQIKIDDKGKEIVTEVVGHLEGMEKVIQGEWHPLASDLIAVLCQDSGKSEIRLWDVSKEGYRRIQLGYSVNF
jgi:coronin-7